AHPYQVTLLLALLIRIGAFHLWYTSPLNGFSAIPGLDMLTHLQLGQLFLEGKTNFAPYRILSAVVLCEPMGLILLQLTGGIITALLSVFITLRISGNRTAALLAGVFAASYACGLLYECFTLPESLSVLIVTASLAALLQARRKHFAWKWSFAAGLLLGLAGTGRPVSLIWVAAAGVWVLLYLHRRKWLRRVWGGIAGVWLIWLLAATWNYTMPDWYFLPFYGDNFRYAAAVAAETELQSWNVAPAEKPDYGAIAMNFFRKIPAVWSAKEIPDNLNYNFFREEIPLFRMLLPVPFLMICGVAGLLALIPVIRRKEGILLWYALTLPLIITAYFPVGRYRLVLFPVLAVAAGMFLARYRQNVLRNSLCLGAVLVANLGMLPWAQHRYSDVRTWAMAAERSTAPRAVVDDAFYLALERNQGNPKDFAQMMNYLLSADRKEEAAALMTAFPGEDAYRHYYSGVLMLGAGNFAGAEAVLRAVAPEDIPELKVPRAYFLGECCRLQGKRDAALEAYRLGLSCNPVPAMRKTLEARIAALTQ
ncbi:MAG: hypothetical protein J6R85_05920, partial [Lentisphaeria bacterium]|nr:hypothetical protein [Lentisphaeria bacterium]